MRPWTEEEIRNETERIINNPTRLDRIKAFYQFANSESHGLVKFGYMHSYCVQQAYNLAKSGPVSGAAQELVSNTDSVLLLRRPFQRPEYNPFNTLLRTMDNHTDSVKSVSITPDGKLAVSGSYDNTLRVWDIESGQCLRKLEGHTSGVNCVSITPDGKLAVSGSYDQTLRIWDIEIGQCLKTFPDYSWLNDSDSVSITPNGKLAVLAGGFMDKTIRVWDIANGQCLKTLENQTVSVESVSITPDGELAVSGSHDKTLRIWDIESGQYLKKLEGHTSWVCCVSITPDGRLAVSSSLDQTIRIWDIKSGQCMKTLKGHTSGVYSISITPDGKRVMSGSSDQTIRVWDIESGQCLAIYLLDRTALSLSQMRANGVIVIGTTLGDVIIINLHNLLMMSPLTTPIRIWLYEENGSKENWDKCITAGCQWCGQRHEVDDKVLDVIRAINRNAGLTPDQSPCLFLPYEAWDDLRLLSECPHCKKPLKFNPFIVDNRDRY